MPELPEVESLVLFLRERIVDRRVSQVALASISALKTFNPPVTELVNSQVLAISRRGKFIDVAMVDANGEPIHLVTHLARAGWLQWRDELPTTVPKPGKGPLAFRIGFVDDDGALAGGFDLTEAGTQKKLTIHVVRDLDDIERVHQLGPEPLDEDFTVEVFSALLSAAGRRQLKGLLRDQTTIAGIGNAYSDDILHTAKLSPFLPADSLDPDVVSRLYDSLRATLNDAMSRSAGLAAGDLKSEKKLGMRVHGRTGQQCPECGDVIREVSFADSSLQYCATCQTGGTPLADRRTSKFLK
ncbi:MAG: DNA-formamidopyrimidine glycosylase family protein [Actinomycetes bacterium]